MKLRGIEFQPCWDAPGVRGFFGEGYWPHRAPIVGPLWYNFKGSTRVTKTVTLNPQAGNMPLCGAEYNFAPTRLFPSAIWFNMFTGETLNAINLSGPGARVLFDQGLLLSREPFMISFMAVGKTREERKLEFSAFAAMLLAVLEKINALRNTVQGFGLDYAPFAIQINISCPNTGHDPGDLVEDGEEALKWFAPIPVPKIVKVNILAPVKAVKLLADHPECDAICFSNAIPFGAPLGTFDWNKRFRNGSPLKGFGGGGYSTRKMLPLVCEYSRRLRVAGVEKSFNLGGGIRCADDVDYAVSYGDLRPKKDSIFFASAAIASPWNIRSIIAEAHNRLS